MKIQDATIADIPLIGELAKKSWQHAYKDILSPQQISYMLNEFYSENSLLRQFENPDYSYQLYLDDEKNIGFSSIELNYRPQICKLHRLYFLPEAHGMGYGKKAIEFIIKKAKENGCRELVLNVNKKNPAINFYEKCGFQLFASEMINIGNGVFMDDYVMKMLL